MSLPLLLILVLALGLRLIALGQSFWLDEAVQLWASSSFSIKELLLKYLPNDFNPPLYHLLLHFWVKVFGTSEVGVRLLPVALGLASIFLVWQIANIIGGKRLAVFSSLLLATSPLHVYYSQENRMYLLSCFAVLLATFSFLRLLAEQNWKNSIFFGFSLLLMVFSHFLTFFVLPVFFFFGIRKIEKNKFLFPFALVVIAYLIYLPIFLKQLQTGIGMKQAFPDWGKVVGGFSLKEVALLPVKLIIGRVSIANKLIYGLISLLLVAIYWGLAILGGIRSLKLVIGNRKLKIGVRNNNLFLIFCLLFFPPLIGFLISFRLPVFSYFRFLFILPFFYLLISLAITAEKWPKTKMLWLLLLIINLVFSGVYLLNSNFHREDWRGMVNWLHKANQAGSSVLILGQVSKPFEYYDQNQSRLIIIDRVSDLDLGRSVYDNQLFLVSYGLPIFDPEDRIRRELIRLGYQVIRGESFRKVGVEEHRK